MERTLLSPYKEPVVKYILNCKYLITILHPNQYLTDSYILTPQVIPIHDASCRTTTEWYRNSKYWKLQKVIGQQFYTLYVTSVL